jgi:DNA modification methylase
VLLWLGTRQEATALRRGLSSQRLAHPTIAPGTATIHPTSKPLEVFALPMRQHTQLGDICYEPFSGSGSQLVAGGQLGRLVYGLEKEPRCADLGRTPRRVE